MVRLLHRAPAPARNVCHMAYWIVKLILTPLLRCVYRLDVRGAGNVPKRGPVIVASNHQSFIDSIFIPLVVRRRVTFVAKAEYFENRRTAWFFRAVGQIPIQRGGGSAADRALASAREVLDAGGLLGIYPEGTRTPDGRMYRGHTGVARLALACNATVVPVALGGTAEVQPVGAMRPRLFRRVRVRFGRPMTWPDRAQWADDPVVLRQVTDEIMDAIGVLSGQERVDGYAKRGAHPSGQRRRQPAPGSAPRPLPGAADPVPAPVAPVPPAVNLTDAALGRAPAQSTVAAP
jgi:1-acyl-sn-glycerol-3-phosphate acyltransferase